MHLVAPISLLEKVTLIYSFGELDSTMDERAWRGNEARLGVNFCPQLCGLCTITSMIIDRDTWESIDLGRLTWR